MPVGKKPLRVYLFSPGGVNAPGGIAKIVDYTVRGWPATSNYTIKVVDTYGPDRKYKMPIYFIGSLVTFLGGVLRRSIDVVHINMSERLSVWRKMTLVVLAKIFRVPVVLHMHGADFADYYRGLDRPRKIVLNHLMRRCDVVLVLGGYWRDFVTREIGVDVRSVHTLCNAAPSVSDLPTRRQEACRFLFLGVVGERKGVGTLIQALASPQLAPLDWDAVIAGNGEIDRYRALAEQLGLKSRVTFTGLLAEGAVRQQLMAANVLVLPSRNEGLPMAILEAMSAGCAIVATPVGSIGEAVISEETGLIVDVGDVEGLSAALSRMAADRNLRETLGRNAKARFDATFSLSSYVVSLEAIYDRCLTATERRLT